MGDYDNDGWEDLYITYYGKNRLYHNRNGVFEEVAEKAGVAGSGGPGEQAALSLITIATVILTWWLRTTLISIKRRLRNLENGQLRGKVAGDVRPSRAAWREEYSISKPRRRHF